MARILEGVTAFLDQDRWPTSPGELPSTMRSLFRGDHGTFPCVAYAVEEHQQLIFYSVTPRKAPMDRLDVVGELLHRANYGLHLGNFELDHRDGEIRFKTSIDVEGVDLAPELIRSVIYSNVLQMDRYYPALVAVLDEGISPEAAIARIED